MGTGNDKWSVANGGTAMEMRYLWELVSQSREGVVATTYKDHWVYGVHRLKRLLVVFVPSEVPVHRLEDYAAKMSKEYFFKAYM